MAKFNIYRIKPNEDVALRDKFSGVNLRRQKTKNIDGWEFTFFFSQTPDEVDIWWIDEYKSFLNNPDQSFKNQIYYAVMLAKKDKEVFAVSLGKSHFYVRDYSDQDFGLELAERIANEKDVKIKNTKFFKNKRNKVITSYVSNSQIDFESGESMHFLKARSVDTEKWGKTVNFGQSILFTLDADYMRLPKLFDDILDELKKPSRFPLPKVIPVKVEDKIKALDRKLCAALANKDGQGAVEESQFSLHGVDFIFSDEYQYSFFVSGQSRDKTEAGPLTMERFGRFVADKSIDISSQLNELKVTVHKEHSRDHSEPFKNFVEYVDEKEKVCLIDGNWYIFNQSYLDYLKQEIDSIACDIQINAEKLPVEESYLKKCQANGYFVIHTSMETVDKKYSVEAGDMIRGDTLYVVKKGTPQKLNYAIDQAMSSIYYLQENNGKVKVGGKEYEIKKICILLLLDRKTSIKHLFDLNSLIFHMKVIDWHRQCRNLRFEPLVEIQQFTGTDN